MTESRIGPGGAARRLLAQWEAILQQMPAGVILAEAPSGRLILGNRNAEAIWHGPLIPSASVGEDRAWRGFHPDGRPYLAEEWPLARSIARGEVVHGEEIEIVRADGTRGTVRVSSSPIRDEAGRIIAALATFDDITEQRRQETGRRILSEASAVLVSSLDYETTLRNVARLAVPALADWCGVDMLREDGKIERLVVEHVDPTKASLAREVAERYPPDPRSATGIARVLRTGKAELVPEITEEMLRGVARDAEHLRILQTLGLRAAMIVPLIARGKILGAITLIAAESARRYGPEDLALTEELAVRAALAIDNARLYRQSQVANRAKADFLAVVSHELRTPLTAIIGYTELLGLGIPEPVTERQRDHLDRVEIAARHLLQLIEEILTMASLEAGHARIRRQRVSVAELLQRAEVIIRPMAMAKELGLEVSIPDREVILETDSDKVLQVLLNLLSNAVKFTERGSIQVSAETRGDFLEVIVRDTGIGMDPSHRERIFEPFWQVEKPITRRAGGTGLGLTITRRLLDLLGGEVEVESQPGAGSTFVARIPMRVGKR